MREAVFVATLWTIHLFTWKRKRERERRFKERQLLLCFLMSPLNPHPSRHRVEQLKSFKLTECPCTESDLLIVFPEEAGTVKITQPYYPLSLSLSFSLSLWKVRSSLNASNPSAARGRGKTSKERKKGKENREENCITGSLDQWTSLWLDGWKDEDTWR